MSEAETPALLRARHFSALCDLDEAGQAGFRQVARQQSRRGTMRWNGSPDGLRAGRVTIDLVWIGDGGSVMRLVAGLALPVAVRAGLEFSGRPPFQPLVRHLGNTPIDAPWGRCPHAHGESVGTRRVS